MKKYMFIILSLLIWLVVYGIQSRQPFSCALVYDEDICISKTFCSLHKYDNPNWCNWSGEDRTQVLCPKFYCKSIFK